MKTHITVDVLILLLIFFREYLWDGLIWVIGKCRASVDGKVMDYLGGLNAGVDKTVEEISLAVEKSQKKVKASLDRLSDKHHVSRDQEGRWHQVRDVVH